MADKTRAEIEFEKHYGPEPPEPGPDDEQVPWIEWHDKREGWLAAWEASGVDALETDVWLLERLEKLCDHEDFVSIMMGNHPGGRFYALLERLGHADHLEVVDSHSPRAALLQLLDVLEQSEREDARR